MLPCSNTHFVHTFIGGSEGTGGEVKEAAGGAAQLIPKSLIITTTIYELDILLMVIQNSIIYNN